MSQKNVNIVGMSIVKDFGALKATKLTFDKNNRLTMIKGEVGAGKTTLRTVGELTTKGSDVLKDKALYGNVDLVTQLVDGENNIFIGCRTAADRGLDYFLYMVDKDGNKINDPVIDGAKATPAAYMKTLQTALTWRMDELTSQNPITVRNILLELYSKELEEQGVVFDKSSPKYVDGIIDKIEKAKTQRNLMDMRRKEVGGIADDMTKKGIDFTERKEIVDLTAMTVKIATLTAEIELDKANPQKTKDDALKDLALKGGKLKDDLRLKNDELVKLNIPIQAVLDQYAADVEAQQDLMQEINSRLEKLFPLGKDGVQPIVKTLLKSIRTELPTIPEPTVYPHRLIQFSDKGVCMSKPDDFKDNAVIFALLTDYRKVGVDYTALKDKPLKAVNTKKKDDILDGYKTRLENMTQANKEAAAVNAYINWQEANEAVKNLNKDYYKKLTQIKTGVKGLYICPEYDTDDDGKRLAKGNDIYLMYDGSYDPKYFNNLKKEPRKLSAYSDTQKPMICLLIQNYLLSKKAKILPYLWIDQVPIDNKTKELLERMSEELGLWLFVNWTGDFKESELKDGEILIQNGEIFSNLKTNTDE